MTKEIESAVEYIKIFAYAANSPDQETIEHLQTLLSLAQLFLKVKGMPEKREHEDCDDPEVCSCGASFFNEAIDACTAHLVKKCEGIEEVILDTFVKEKLWNATQNLISQILGQAIKEYLLK